jgi:hypothetical protein
MTDLPKKSCSLPKGVSVFLKFNAYLLCSFRTFSFLNQTIMGINFKLRCASFIIVAAGYGWAGGHYIPADSSLLAYVFQFVVISAILMMGLSYFSMPGKVRDKNNWAVKGMSIFSAIMFVLNIGNIIHGAYTKDKSSPGSHNSFADLVPIALILIGTGLWLVTLLRKKNDIDE